MWSANLKPLLFYSSQENVTHLCLPQSKSFMGILHFAAQGFLNVNTKSFILQLQKLILAKDSSRQFKYKFVISSTYCKRVPNEGIKKIKNNKKNFNTPFYPSELHIVFLDFTDQNRQCFLRKYNVFNEYSQRRSDCPAIRTRQPTKEESPEVKDDI